MKKLLSIAICASAVAAFGTDVSLELGEIGVTAVTSSTTNTIVAVSYTDLDTGNVTASNLVKTTNLTIGDYLYVYVNGDLKAFELKGDVAGAKYWDGVSTVTPAPEGAEITPAISADSSAARLAVGTGVWLVRNSGWEGPSFTFYIYGKPAIATSVSVPAGTSMLVGNPTQTGKVPTVTPNVGDKVVVPYASSKTGMRSYTYYSGTGWKYSLRQTSDFTLPSIPAGTGFWYVTSSASGAAEVTISWD